MQSHIVAAKPSAAVFIVVFTLLIAALSSLLLRIVCFMGLTQPETVASIEKYIVYIIFAVVVLVFIYYS